MNRAILISRPDPTVEDLHLTGKRIFESSASSILDDKNFTSNLSVGYDDFLKNENSSDYPSITHLEHNLPLLNQ